MDEITTPITVETTKITAPVETQEQVVDAPVSVVDLAISAPVSTQQTTIDAPVTEQRQVIEAPVYMGLNGDPGLPLAQTVTALHSMSGHRVVSIFNNSASYTNRATDYNSRLGVTNGAANEGSPVVVTLLGPMTEPSWNFTPGAVFVGDDGFLTQTIPTGNIIRAGNATRATTMIIEFKQPLLRN